MSELTGSDLIEHTEAALRGYALALYEDLRLMPLLRRLMQTSCRLTAAAGGSISIVDHFAQRYSKIAEYGTACQLGRSFPLNQGVTGRVMASRRPVVLGAYREIASGHLPAGHPAWNGAVAAIPIWWHGDVVGVNVVFAGSPRAFSTGEVDQLELLTQLAAPAVVAAIQRDLPLSGYGDRCRVSFNHVPTGVEVVPRLPSVAEVALKLDTLCERAGVSSGCTGERLYVALACEDEGLRLLVRRHSKGGVSEVCQSGSELVTWQELVDRVDGNIEVRPASTDTRPQPEAVRATDSESPTSPLSPRQHEVATLLARGLSDRAIAEALVISPKTVEKHVGALLRKTGTTTRTGAAMRIIERGWLDDGPAASH